MLGDLQSQCNLTLPAVRQKDDGYRLSSALRRIALLITVRLDIMQALARGIHFFDAVTCAYAEDSIAVQYKPIWAAGRAIDGSSLKYNVRSTAYVQNIIKLNTCRYFYISFNLGKLNKSSSSWSTSFVCKSHSAISV